MDTVTATELHDRTSELTEQAMRDPERPIVVEKHGKPAVVLVDARYFEGLLETLDLLGDPEAMEQIREGLAAIEDGRLIDHAEMMKEVGLGTSTNRNSMVRARKQSVAKNRQRHSQAKNSRKSK
ncbi:MAG TPA: type II toxin-antitoxin system Phd/YefM family antitoxin [Tepidisphaeraceae bacterium]|jgi:prevent-host-death family protein|nr:type II toxin-antitoxin system Phd/YefM family antitoxin [Tepidisphaeraceae bacterium]